MGFNFYSLRQRLTVFTVFIFLQFFALPLLIPVFLLFGLYRFFVQILAVLFRRDLVSYVRGPGIPMALEHLTVKNSKFNVIVVAIFEGNLTLEQVLGIVEKRAADMVKPNGEKLYPELHQYWVNFMGYLFWKWDENFSFKNHIRNYEPDNLRESRPLREKDMEQILSELMPMKWTAGQSPWEAIRISNYIPTGKSEPHLAMLIRFHHTIGDGFSVKELFENFGGVQFKTPQMEAVKYKWWKRILRFIYLAIKMPLDMARQITNSVDGSSSLHVLDQKLSREYYTCVMQEEIPTKMIKEIAGRTHAKYTSVLYTAMIGGMRKVLEQANMKVPKSMACLVPLPLPARPEGLINHMWVFALKLPIGVDSQKERLRIIDAQFQGVRSNGTIVVYLMAYKLMFLIPTPLLSFAFNRIQATMGSSVFPGPEIGVEDYLGSKLVDVFFHLGNPSGKMGIVGCTMSAMGRQHFMYMVDKTISPPEHIFNSIGTHTAQELDSLYNTFEGQDNPGFIV
ncbi:unnamed protein product [Allacma fusca]|uniref:Diacylglycerol O-acyltransferase n=1 Tax=Allacma fusca TaxID=39272 RepID=A0A8J2LQ25_9HEXA|nr:unnamed protein product [Allacma fusca]